MTRREVLKYCGVAGGAILVSTNGPLPKTFASAPQSPPTTPFRDPLPVPPVPKASFTRFADLDLPARDAAAFVDFSPNQQRTNFYTIRAKERSVFVHKDFQDRGLATSIWGYVDDQSPDNPTAPTPGPTFMLRMNTDPKAGNIARFVNGLSPDATGFGRPFLTTHQHGGHQPSRSDGFPGLTFRLDDSVFDPAIPPGGSYDYTYPLVDAGFFSSTSDPTERPSTMWYHDHIVDFTAPNVYRGLAGFFLVFDEKDTGDENTGLRLPSGEHDVPLLIQDKMFGPDASLVFDPFNTDGFLGDKFMVNGVIQPFLEVQRRRYRFRFLNGSTSRFYSMFLTDSSGKAFPMAVVATEGGLLSSTQQPVPTFLIAPAERYEVVVDFTMFKPGDKVYFEDRLVQDNGRGPEGTFEQPGLARSGTRMLEFRVGGTPANDPSANFYQPGMPLRPFAAISQAEINAVKTVRTFEFNRSHGAWTVNGNLFDINRSDAQPRMEVGEIWHVVNKSGGWWHPNHVHLQLGHVLKRNGKTPPIFERDGIAKKDTVILGPGSDLDVFVKFKDYPGPYVAHCHNLTHEDMAMMFRYDVVAQAGQNFI